MALWLPKRGLSGSLGGHITLAVRDEVSRRRGEGTPVVGGKK